MFIFWYFMSQKNIDSLFFDMKFFDRIIKNYASLYADFSAFSLWTPRACPLKLNPITLNPGFMALPRSDGDVVRETAFFKLKIGIKTRFKSPRIRPVPIVFYWGLALGMCTTLRSFPSLLSPTLILRQGSKTNVSNPLVATSIIYNSAGLGAQESTWGPVCLCIKRRGAPLGSSDLIRVASSSLGKINQATNWKHRAACRALMWAWVWSVTSDAYALVSRSKERSMAQKPSV